jgi:type IV pilus assembly protein PilA
MVVIAIIAILAAVAIPMYSNYTTRANLGSELSKVGSVKAEVAEALSNNTIPSGGSINLPTGVTIDAASTSTSGVIDIDTSDIVANTALTLTGTASGSVISWTCASTGTASLTSSQLPGDCTPN